MGAASIRQTRATRRREQLARPSLPLHFSCVCEGEESGGWGRGGRGERWREGERREGGGRGWRLSVRGLRLTSCPVPAGDADSACLLYAAHSPLAGPRGRLPTESAHANCDGPSLPPVRDSLTSLSARHYRRGALRRQRTPGPGPGHGVGCPQCWITVYKLPLWFFSELCKQYRLTFQTALECHP